MLASHEWLKALSGVQISAQEMAEKLTSAGLEVESLTRKGEGLDHVVVAEVRAMRPHPAREKLRWSPCSTASASKRWCAARPTSRLPGAG
jgi:phenylalanyl-tRNA synthetase beta chain